MRVLLFGGGGMLGHKVWQTFHDAVDLRVIVRGAAERFESLPWFRRSDVIPGFDVGEPSRVDERIATERPDVVINCAGIVKQRAEGKDPIASIKVNALFPNLLRAACARSGARLIHISTDCVFSGNRGKYVESDSPDPIDLYGRSKLLGEPAAPALTLRTSIIGRELSGANGLLEWFLANRGGRIRGFTHAFFSGISTAELARILFRVVVDHPSLEGMYHLASEPISKHDLLVLLNEAMQTCTTIESDGSLHNDRTLDDTHFRATTGIVTPSWALMARELAEEAGHYDDWRPHTQPRG